MKTAIVTGASGGIGQAIALKFLELGFQVIAIARDGDKLFSALNHPNTEHLALDLTDHDAVRAAIGDRRIDVLVNNAGLMPPLGSFVDMQAGDIDRTIALNLTAQLNLTQAVVKNMIKAGQGHIFFTGSTAGHAPFANIAVYGATKAALGSFAQTLRVEIAPTGIRVSEIVAGRVETGLYRNVLSDDERARMYADGQAVQPRDVADMVAAVYAMPSNVNVARFDIVPTHINVPSGSKGKS